MTQKELNYVEDFFNHEILIREILMNTHENIEDENYEKLINNHLNTHEKIINNLLKLLGGDDVGK